MKRITAIARGLLPAIVIFVAVTASYWAGR
jgi:hypothetical protein